MKTLYYNSETKSFSGTDFYVVAEIYPGSGHTYKIKTERVLKTLGFQSFTKGKSIYNDGTPIKIIEGPFTDKTKAQDRVKWYKNHVKK